MNQVTVETTGNFMLLDRFSRCEIPAQGSATVPVTAFIEERVANGDLRLIDGELPVEAEAPIEPDETPADETDETPVNEADETPADETPAETVDADNDGHDDNTGQFVDGNQEAAGPARGARRGGRRGK